MVDSSGFVVLEGLYSLVAGMLKSKTFRNFSVKNPANSGFPRTMVSDLFGTSKLSDFGCASKEFSNFIFAKGRIQVPSLVNHRFRVIHLKIKWSIRGK